MSQRIDEINFNMDGYKTYTTPTNSGARGTSLFISESLKSSRRSDKLADKLPDLENFLYSDKQLVRNFCK